MKTTSCDVGYMCLELYYNYDNDANEYDINYTSFQTNQPSHQAKALDKFLSVFQSFSKLKNLA